MNKLTELLMVKSKQPTSKVPTPLLSKVMNGFFRDKISKRENEKRYKKKKGFTNFRVSELGYEPRLLYLSTLGFIQWADSPASVRRLENGTGTHERWERWVEEAGILVAKEQNVECGNPPVRGRYDFKIKLDGLLWVAELKSMNSSDYSQSKEPKFKDIVQQAMYMELDGVPRGYIIYENKDNNTPKYFETQLDVDTGTVHIACPRYGYIHFDNLVPKIFSKLDYVLECIIDGAVPIPCPGCNPKCKWVSECKEATRGKPQLKPQDIKGDY